MTTAQDVKNWLETVIESTEHYQVIDDKGIEVAIVEISPYNCGWMLKLADGTEFVLSIASN